MRPLFLSNLFLAWLLLAARRSASAQQYDDEGGYGGEGGYNDGGGGGDAGGGGADDPYYSQDNLYHDYAMRQQQKEDKTAGYVAWGAGNEAATRDLLDQSIQLTSLVLATLHVRRPRTRDLKFCCTAVPALLV
jgi:hypothetical protein